MATRFDTAPQQVPRPLPLFLDMLQRVTAASPERRRSALAGLRAYQSAPRAEQTLAAVPVAQAGRATLLDYGGSGRPIVFVPSLINPPLVLDLADRSLLRWLSQQGFRPFLVDWGTPQPAERDCDLACHIETMLLPLLRTIDPAPILAGYCLGGTLALAAAQRLPAAALVLIATPWQFSGFGEAARTAIAQLWNDAQAASDGLGAVPMEVLQAGFWSLDPERTIAKFERFATLDPESDTAHAFVALEDWANGGAPIPFAAGRDLFDRLIARDEPGRGAWSVGGEVVEPARLACPIRQFVSATDRIVPAATAAAVGEVSLLSAGHVGMVVGGRARGALWEPLRDWCNALPAPR